MHIAGNQIKWTFYHIEIDKGLHSIKCCAAHDNQWYKRLQAFTNSSYLVAETESTFLFSGGGVIYFKFPFDVRLRIQTRVLTDSNQSESFSEIISQILLALCFDRLKFKSPL